MGALLFIVVLATLVILLEHYFPEAVSEEPAPLCEHCTGVAWHVTEEHEAEHWEPWVIDVVSRVRKELKSAQAMNERCREALVEHQRLFEELDKAMASEERIAQDTQFAGGFVSTLDLTETAEDIVKRAIAIIREYR